MNEHGLKEDILGILRILSSGNDLSQRDISDHLGFSLGKTNYLLKFLTRKELIKVRNFTARKGEIKKVKYVLTKEGMDEKLKLAGYFLRRKENEYLELKSEMEKTLHEH